MASEFEEASILNIAAPVPNATAAGPFGSNLVSRDYTETGVPVIRGQNLLSRWVGGDFVYVSPEKAAALRTNTARPGDIVFTQRGTLGQVAMVPDGEFPLYVISQSQMKLSIDSTKADASYVYYACTSQHFVRQVLDNAVAAGVPHINLGTLRALTIPLPELTEQERISGLLGALDDRIDLLRQTNATLEAIAQALFKSWFVDFDPVRAKAEGREPEGMDAATTALFPSEFEESELGLIPKGWRVLSLSEAFEINPRRSIKKGSITPYLDMASVPTSGHVPAPPIDREFSSGSKFQNGDTLLARITPCLENGKTAHVDFLADDQVGWGSTEFIVLRPRPPLPLYFGYLIARHDSFRTFATQAMTGTSGRQRVELGQLERFQVVCPDAPVATAFGLLVEPIRVCISANHKRSGVLANLRDTLLPSLISGKLRLAEAKKANEEAVT